MFEPRKLLSVVAQCYCRQPQIGSLEFSAELDSLVYVRGGHLVSACHDCIQLDAVELDCCHLACFIMLFTREVFCEYIGTEWYIGPLRDGISRCDERSSVGYRALKGL